MIKLKLVLVLYLLTFCLAHVCAANSDTINKRVPFTEKDILVDRSDSLAQKMYPKNFQNKYNSTDFVYTEKAPVKSID